MPKDPKGQNNIENENVKLDSQSVQNENSANMFVQIELGSDYDLKQILSSGKYGNNNIIAEENQNGGTKTCTMIHRLQQMLFLLLIG